MRREIVASSSPEAEFGFARAVVQDPFVFVSCVYGYDPFNMEMPEDVVQQTCNIWDSISGHIAAGRKRARGDRQDPHLHNRSGPWRTRSLHLRTHDGGPQTGLDAVRRAVADAPGNEGRYRGHGDVAAGPARDMKACPGRG